MDYAIINLGGRIVADLVERQGKDGKEFATFSIAVNQYFAGQEQASYYDCVVPGFMYQTMQKAGVTKGSAISLTGKQTIRTYKERDGHNGTSVNINVLDWRYEGPRTKSSEAQPANGGTSARQTNGGGEADAGQQTGIGSVQPTVNLQDEDDLPV